MNNKELTILHFSDFHLDGKDIEGAKNMVESIVSAIEKSDHRIDLIVFTGDMLNMGGVSFDNKIELGFKKFEDVVINPLCNKLNLTLDRFVFIPGNHDLNRDDDDEAIMAELKR